MYRPKTLQRRKQLPGILLVSLVIVLSGCTHRAIADCGGEVLGVNEPRIRSSHFRMLLADLPAASEQLLPYAAMSSLAYAEDRDCGTSPEDQKVSPQDREDLEAILSAKGWKEVRDPLWVPACESKVGLYLRVWERDTNARKEVVIAFRGTWGAKDWIYGNAHYL